MKLFLLLNQKTEESAFTRAVISAPTNYDAVNILFRCLEGYPVFFAGNSSSKCVYNSCFSRDVDESQVLVHEIGECSVRASGVFVIS